MWPAEWEQDLLEPCTYYQHHPVSGKPRATCQHHLVSGARVPTTSIPLPQVPPSPPHSPPRNTACTIMSLGQRVTQYQHYLICKPSTTPSRVNPERTTSTTLTRVIRERTTSTTLSQISPEHNTSTTLTQVNLEHNTCTTLTEVNLEHTTSSTLPQVKP